MTAPRSMSSSKGASRSFTTTNELGRVSRRGAVGAFFSAEGRDHLERPLGDGLVRAGRAAPRRGFPEVDGLSEHDVDVASRAVEIARHLLWQVVQEAVDEDREDRHL